MNKIKLSLFGKVLGFVLVFQLVSLVSFAQDPKGLNVRPRSDKSESSVSADKNYCLSQADTQIENTKTDHKTLKNTGVGAGAGAVGGSIVGKPGLGAVIGGAAGAVRGRKKSENDKESRNQMYASCLRDKGYDVDVYDE